MIKNEKLIIVRGAGDIASGIIWGLSYAGYKVLCIDIEKPTCIRREVSFSEAIYDGEKTIDGVKCVKAKNHDDVKKILDDGNVAILIDEKGQSITDLKPYVLIDAILAKKNIGTKKDMADIVIAVGPGFTAGVDCHFVIETKRGHTLGKIIENGSPIPNTGIPGIVGGIGKERVMHSPAEGIFKNKHKISDIVKKGDILADIIEYKNGKETGKNIPLYATIDGVLRGILRDGFYAFEGLKCADIDPRIEEVENCFSISDKARCIAGSVVMLISRLFDKNI